MSPYRIQLAGIQTSAVTYQPLVQEATTGGSVNEDGTISAEVFGRELSLVREGQTIAGFCDALPGQGSCRGRVQSVKAQWVGGRWRFQMRLAMDNQNGDLKPGMFVTLNVRVPPSQWGWYRRLLMESWRDSVMADMLAHSLFSPVGLVPGAGLESLGQATLQQVMLHQGFVQAIPESAIVDTGRQKIVFIESVPGVFDAVEVVVGAKCGNYHVLVRGPESGQRVVTTGAFLIDAESRLNPAASSLYFGSGGAPQESLAISSGSRQTSALGGTLASSATSAEDREIRSARLQLSREDQLLVEAQEFCPIQQKNRLGSMGKPFKILINNTPVFLCCDGCREEATAHPTETLAKVEQLKNRVRNKTQGK